MGGKEFSGTRPLEQGQDKFDALVAGYAPALEAILKSQGAAHERCDWV